MRKTALIPILTALAASFGGLPPAAAHPPLRGFVCAIDLPPFDPSGPDSTSKTTTDSQLNCEGSGQHDKKNTAGGTRIHLKCRAPITVEEFNALGGKTLTYKDTPCQIDLRMCGTIPAGAQRFVLASKSELLINKKEAKIECQL
jgi:hypothetical protein